VGDILLKGLNVSEIEWDFDLENSCHKVIIKCDDGNVEIFKYNISLQLEKLRKTDYSENQSYTAIHESGHALVSLIKLKLIPKLVVSKSANCNSEGFCRIDSPTIRTKETEYNSILLALGGRAAEKFILKNDKMLSVGSYSDLRLATETANSMIKCYGHGDSPILIRHSSVESNSFKSDDLLNYSEKLAVNLIKNAEKEVDEIMSNNRELLIEMIDHLSNNSQLNSDEIKNIIRKYNLEIKDKDSYYNIKERISEFKKNLDDRKEKILCNY
jgi:ATP-dependent Zn protease